MVWQIVGMLAMVFAIGISIAVHEFGHLVPAKRFGVRVSDYAIGFGPAIFSRRIGETLYAWRLIPLGGFIQMIGMYPPRREHAVVRGRLGKLAEEARQQSMEQVLPSDEGRTFFSLPVHKRTVIMLGGPLMNAVLAFVFFTIALSGIGVQTPTTTVGEVPPCTVSEATPTGALVKGSCPDGASPAARAGIRKGDVIVAINGKRFSTWEGMTQALIASPDGGSGTATVLRDGKEVVLDVEYASVERERYDASGNTVTYRRAYLGLGTTWAREHVSIARIPGVMSTMTAQSVHAMGQFPVKIVELTKTLFTDGQRDINGPVSVVGATRIGGEIAAAEWDTADKIVSLLMMAASLNLFLCLFNLLPLLPLDGGHVAGAVYEVFRDGIARLRGRRRLGPVDTARMLPITYAVSTVLIAVGGLVIWADIVKPISLG